MKNEAKKELGKLCMDIAKILFGGIVLTSVIKIEGISKIFLIIVGIIVVLIFIWLGYKLIKNN
ncbi:MAG: hypothetical protein HY738_02835 [Bacteroidia bacterium]|nr:hypothetical protein [Bacteroidia bacterium]